MSMFQPSGIDPDQIDANVRSLTRPPLLSLALVVIFAAFAAWWFTGGSANGSTHQAEQLITSTNNQTSRAHYGGVYYSDDLSLVKDAGTWRIVHKTYYAHPA